MPLLSMMASRTEALKFSKRVQDLPPAQGKRGHQVLFGGIGRIIDTRL
jgi:hypothetical protein